MSEEQERTSRADTGCSAREKRPGEEESDFLERQAISSRMCRIGRKIVVLSGKGGVGKSTVAVNLAAGLAMAGKRVGLMDIDIHGPSIPKLMHLENATISGSDGAMHPVRVAFRPGVLSIMSIGFLLPGRDDAVIWRGPMKYGVIKQFLRDVDWGDLDFLIVDSPPGTGDEPLSVVQLVDRPDGAVIVTTPQDVAVQDVRRSIMFCRQLSLPVIGVIENMRGFVCPHCGGRVDIFGSGGGEAMARDLGVPFLGSIPIDTQIVESGDQGRPMVQSQPHSGVSTAFGRVVRSLLEPDLEAGRSALPETRMGAMRIAVPVTGGRLCQHFGHSDEFAVFDVDPDGSTIRARSMLTPPPHEPGVLPRWLHEQGASLIITGGMGARAQSLFAQSGIKVVVGAQTQDAEQVVRAYLDGTLRTGENVCDH